MDAGAKGPTRAFFLFELNRLLELSRSLSSPGTVKLLMVLVFAGALLVQIVPPALHGRFGVPYESGDAPGHDNIALQLCKGNGFSNDWDDKEYKNHLWADQRVRIL